LATGQTDVARLKPKSVDDIQRYLQGILAVHKQYDYFRNKAREIDKAYYRFQEEEDRKAGNVRCGVDIDNIEVPVVVSQVDSYVGYLADVYLSGYPIFPVVSSPKDVAEAEMLEAIIDTHATLGGYARQFLMHFRDGIKYNLNFIEHEWDTIDQFSVMSSYLKPSEAAKLEQTEPKLTKIKRLDPYNAIFDARVMNPADVAFDGEFAGYVELYPRIPLKRFINKHSKSGNLYRIKESLESKWGGFTTVSGGGNYYPHPDVNILINSKRPTEGGREFNWADYLGFTPNTAKGGRIDYSAVYERATFYCRIIPSEFGIDVSRPNSPQIWKFILINGQHLLYARRVYTAFDLLPILIGQPLEDGFAVQTQSIAESQVSMQAIASSLFNIRLASARRAVSDRALYDSTLINQDDINSPVAAPKIPVRLSGLNEKTLKDAYYQIPFNDAGTQSVLGDLRATMEFADILSGLNKPMKGQFQKGNKSVQEWQDTMGGADNRTRLPALCIEMQIMMPLKENIKLNIYQHQPAGIYQASKSGAVYDIDAAKIQILRDKVMSFRLADGYTPKSKLASTEFIMQLLQAISQNELLAQSWGTGLAGMVAHLAQLGGVRDLQQYLPAQPAQSTPQQGAPGAAGTGAAGTA
jgi:hypothetical protein